MHVRRWDYLRSMNQWKTVGIVGAGTMGSGMAQIAAEAGCEVVLVDAIDKALERSKNQLARVMDRLVEKGRRTAEQAAATQERIRRTTDLVDVKGCDLVIEAIVEQLQAKSDLFKALEGIL